MSFRSLLLITVFLFQAALYPQSSWHLRESEHFRLIYKTEHTYLAEHILKSAEKALYYLGKIFNYTPGEKIVINTYDINDFGFASATSVPENFIRLEIEPFESGYENIPYNERFQWVISHELVHIVLNDQATSYEKISRTLFSKVSPEQIQPLTVLYSLLSNYSRYTSRWHQESSAVFLETWLSGGYGRILGNFDEMYFRSLVYENAEFPSEVKLDAVTSHNSFLLESLFYIYGGRFSAYLADKFGADKLFKWYTVNKNDFYPSYKSKFKDAFNADFDDEWDLFIKNEISFQQENIKRIKAAQVTPVRHLTAFPLGWVTSGYVKPDGNIIFGMHRPHYLAQVSEYNIRTGIIDELATLPSPSIYQVASTAYDSTRGFVYYTTNNNQLYRDVWALDTKTGKTKEIFPDLRIGQMSVCPVTGDMWGLQHNAGKTSLVLSPLPYNEIHTIYSVDVPDEILQVSVSPDGSTLAAVIHKSSGIQELVIINVSALLSGQYIETKVTGEGSPENPSWSPDGITLFWNAYVNGVSNIYRFNLISSRREALSNVVRGLFRPVLLNSDSLFVFEFSSEGFIPSVIANQPAVRLPAIAYFGQDVLNKNPQLAAYSLPEFSDTAAGIKIMNEEEYSGLSNLKVQAFVPVVSGFQKQAVLGIYARVSDPLINHDFTAEIGYSPFKQNSPVPRFHLKLKYEYMKKLEIGVDHNATDFYDLFNKRKRGTIGTKLRAGYTNYWLYDNPHKIKQNTEIAVYTDFEYINDNLVRVTEPDFGVAQTIWNSKNLRRSIGSSDFESGTDITITGMLFGSDPQDPQFAGDVHAEFDNFFLYLAHHNVFHYKIAGGYHWKNDRLHQAMFYFGGFGNREVENTDVKQFRSVFRFPGIPIYSLPAERFIKVMFENNLPPIRFSGLYIGQHYLSHIDMSVYTQALLLRTDYENKWIDAGAQINFIFKHWFNLESTFSAGIAKAWSEKTTDWEWFLSYKLLKN